MDVLTIARQIQRVLDNSPAVFLQLQPQAVDFTVGGAGLLSVQGAHAAVEVPFDRESAPAVLAVLEHGLEDRPVLSWNFKNLATLARVYGRKPQPLPWAPQVRDLMVIEYFRDDYTHKKAPRTLQEALGRLQAALDDDCWKGHYKRLHLPLMGEVIPAIEAGGLKDAERGCLLHPYFDIEGTRNGRLKGLKAFERGFDPHHIANTDLRPLDGQTFIHLDYRAMEVAVLAHVSGDPLLQQIVETKENVYSTVTQLLVRESDPERATWVGKQALLPVAYGIGREALAANLGNFELACILIDGIHRAFPVAMRYLRSRLDANASNGVVRDFFGRPRANEGHKTLNFLVQAPASLVCLDRLVALHRALPSFARVACHVHDGYYIVCDAREVEPVFALAKETLEAESDLCPGLKLRTAGAIGDRLGSLKKPA